jgi:L-lactate dehydrogenase (cytochrome)
MEAIAREEMTDEGWGYYSSAADDEVSMRENRTAFQRIFFRPRVLRDMSAVDTSTSLLGSPCAMPLYISACALGKLAHPLGEVGLTMAAGRQHIVHMLPTLASSSLEDMCGARALDATQWFQLYVNRDRAKTAELVQKAEQLGCKALAITVDAPLLGRRERDMRNKFSSEPPKVQKGAEIRRDGGTARAISAWIDPALNWNDLQWLASITRMPLILKGIQCSEDALLAARHPNVRAIVVSNHGGRQLDYARSGVEMLAEVMAALRSEGLQNRIEVYMDGGVRRGTDLLKCLCLGGRAVGIGRPALWGLASYGDAGVERVLEILKEELRMAMVMCGCKSIADIRPEMIDARSLQAHISTVPADRLFEINYRPLPLVSRL